jgi:hypothetical protein
LLADDPGAGKTIMAGLLVKELLIRGDLGSASIWEALTARYGSNRWARRTP